MTESAHGRPRQRVLGMSRTAVMVGGKGVIPVRELAHIPALHIIVDRHEIPRR
jgi:hypothetical protein